MSGSARRRVHEPSNGRLSGCAIEPSVLTWCSMGQPASLPGVPSGRPRRVVINANGGGPDVRFQAKQGAKLMDVDRDFAAFLREWTEQRIWSIDDFLGEADQDFLAEKRSIELIALARERGFDEALTAAVKPYAVCYGT